MTTEETIQTLQLIKDSLCETCEAVKYGDCESDDGVCKSHIAIELAIKYLEKGVRDGI